MGIRLSGVIREGLCLSPILGSGACRRKNKISKLMTFYWKFQALYSTKSCEVLSTSNITTWIEHVKEKFVWVQFSEDPTAKFWRGPDPRPPYDLWFIERAGVHAGMVSVSRVRVCWRASGHRWSFRDTCQRNFDWNGLESYSWWRTVDSPIHKTH